MAEATTKKAKRPSKATAAPKAATPKKTRASSPSTTSSESVRKTKGKAKGETGQLHPEIISLIQTVQDQGEVIAQLRREVNALKETQKTSPVNLLRLTGKMFDSLASSLEPKTHTEVKITLLADDTTDLKGAYCLKVYSNGGFRVVKYSDDYSTALVDFDHQSKDSGVRGLTPNDVALFIKANQLAPEKGSGDFCYDYGINIYVE